jgi:hypothetical protein
MQTRDPHGMNPGPLPQNQGRENYQFSREIEHIEQYNEEPDEVAKALSSPEVVSKMLTRELDHMTHTVAAIFVLLGEKDVNLYDTTEVSAEIRSVLKEFEMGGKHLKALLDARDALREVEQFLRSQVPHERYITEILPEVERFEGKVKDGNSFERKAD